MQAAGLDPLEPYVAGKPWRCRCRSCGQETSVRLPQLKTTRGCRYCNGFAVHPDRAVALMNAAGLDPQTPYTGSGRPWPCRCQRCGASTSPTYDNIRAGHGGCNNCAGKVVAPAAAEAAVRALGWEPQEPYPGSQKPWTLRCVAQQHQTTKRWNDIVNGKPGCRFCAERAVAPEDAIASRQAVGLEPLDAYPGSKAPWRCRCLTCDGLVRPNLNTVRAGGGCQLCGYRRTSDALRRPDAEAAAMARGRGYEPLEPYPGTNRRWRCRHEACGKDCSITFKDITGRGSGCPECAVSGFKPARPAVVYLVTHTELNVHKIGIAGVHSYRLSTWAKAGWDRHGTVHFPVGEDAYKVEQAVLRWLRREQGLPAYLPRSIHGWSETVDAAEISLAEIWAKVHEVRAELLQQLTNAAQ